MAPPVYASGGRLAIRATGSDIEIYSKDGSVYRRVFWGARGRLAVLDVVRLAFLVGSPAIERRWRA